MGRHKVTIELVHPMIKQTYTDECAIFIGTILSIGAKSAASLMHYLIVSRSVELFEPRVCAARLALNLRAPFK